MTLPMTPLLSLEGLTCGYKGIPVLRNMNLDLRAGEIHCLFGRNGAGKTTALKAIMRQVPVDAGHILKNGIEIQNIRPHEVARHGIAYVPQGRRLFADLSVAENLEIGLMARGGDRHVLKDCLKLFPILRERLEQRSGSLSGGEQQMLATARALCLEPDVLLLDEPTEGLMPSMVARIREVTTMLRDNGMSILLVEQRVEAVLDIADRVTFLENGQVRATMTGEELRATPDIIRRYVGIA